MATNLEVKPRRYHMSLWSLDPIDLSPVSKLCDIAGFQTTFSLNQIPIATVGLPPGNEMHTMKDSGNLAELAASVTGKQPLGVILHKCEDKFYATTSKTNDKDPDYYFPDSDVILFKGYAAGSSIRKQASAISIELYIQHWLSDLAAISVYSPRSHMDNPEAYGSYITSVGSEYTAKLWSDVIINTQDAVITDDGIMNIICTLLSNIMHESVDANESILGTISKEYVEKVDRALKRIKSHLKWNDEIHEHAVALVDEILATLGVGSAETWQHSTAWDALVGGYPGQFYFALAPTVNECHAIPMPGPVAQDVIEITQDEITSFESSIPTAPVLGGCVLVQDTYSYTDADGDTNKQTTISHIYPPLDLSKEGAEKGGNENDVEASEGGPLLICKLPGWLRNPRHVSVSSQSDILNSYSNFEITTNMEEEIAKNDKKLQAMDTVAVALTAYVYLCNLYAGRRAIVAMPLRMDICPGASVHIHIEPEIGENKENQTIDLYGIVESVTAYADPTASYTSLVISNIRNKAEYESKIQNPKVSPFYKEIWSGKDTTLYEVK